MNTLRILDILESTGQLKRVIARFLHVLWECESASEHEGAEDPNPNMYTEFARLFAGTGVPWTRSILVSLTPNGEREALGLIKSFSKLQNLIDKIVGENQAEHINGKLLEIVDALTANSKKT